MTVYNIIGLCGNDGASWGRDINRETK